MKPRYKDMELIINEDTKKYKGWYYNKIGGSYYIFKPGSKITAMCFTLDACKRYINEFIREEVYYEK
jgi:hypothetical protein